MIGKRRQHSIKRTIDILAAGAGLAALWPVLVLIAWRIRRTMGPPVLFRQVRPGLHAQPFTMYKFRTMRDAAGADGRPLPDSERLTEFGRLLRRTSLDELPELWNVLRGEMSLVGPRPLLMEYLTKYTPEQARRHEVRAGITGLAQIRGRQTIPFSKRFEYDLYYVDNWSLLLDLKILLQTVFLTFRGTGVRSGQEIREVDDLSLSGRTEIG